MTSPSAGSPSIARKEGDDGGYRIGITGRRSWQSSAQLPWNVRATDLPGVVVVESGCPADREGASACLFDLEAFSRYGFEPRVMQCGILFTFRAGTLRGLHYQRAPHEGTRLIRCTRGRIFNVAVDLRVDSPTYRRWLSIELGVDGVSTLIIPRGCAHGFQTLEDSSEVFYLTDVPYVANASEGVRWNDPAFAIHWPEPPGGERMLSDCDRSYPDYRG